ncbi:MAG: hypothetical protein HN350_21600 [Phycisphaerales bacterium]|nr:hypothetical protein [Phycisphaerales bacterium]
MQKEKLERAYVFAVIRVQGEDWVVARPLGLDVGYGDSWCVRSSRMRDLLDEENPLKYRTFVDALNTATSDCYAGIDLPRAERHANWRDLLGWLSRDQDCHFAHHAEWRSAQLQSGPRALTLEDAYLVMRMSLGLLGPEEIGLLEKHRKLLGSKKQKEDLARQYEIYVDQAEQRLRQSVDELKDQPSGEIFGTAFVNIAERRVSSLNALLEDPDVLDRAELSDLQDALSALLRREGALEARTYDLKTQHEASTSELKNAQKQDANTLWKELIGLRWKCSYFKAKEEAMKNGCPGTAMVDQDIADPWRQQRIKELQEDIAAIAEQQRDVAADLEKMREETARHRQGLSKQTADVVRIRGDITTQIGQWMVRKDEADRYTAAWRDLNKIENGRDARQKRIDTSLAILRQARSRFEKQKADLSAYYEAILKRTISPNAEGEIAVDGDGLRPESNEIVADSGTTLREYADVLSFDLACLAAAICGIGHLPRLWIHDSPRQADSEEQLYFSVLGLVSDLERAYQDGKRPAFQYILTTTSPPPDALNRPPFVRARFHARSGDGKLLRCDFGK